MRVERGCHKAIKAGDRDWRACFNRNLVLEPARADASARRRSIQKRLISVWSQQLRGIWMLRSKNRKIARMTPSFGVKIACVASLLMIASISRAEEVQDNSKIIEATSERLKKIDDFYEAKVREGEISGIVIAVMQHGKMVHSSFIGYADIEHKQRMSKKTVFRLYSMTKPVTAAALMMLYDEGRFSLSDPLAKYLPEFSHMRVMRSPRADPSVSEAAQREITIEDVLRHTAGFGSGVGQDTCNKLLTDAGIYRPEVSLDEMMRKVAKQPLCAQPGTAWMYSLSPDVEARLVEVLSGQPFHQFLRSRLFKPLGMDHTTFVLDRRAARRVARAYTSDGKALVPWTISRLPKDSSMREYPMATLEDLSISYERGSFGLYGTAEDYLRFAQMLLNGGGYKGRQLLSASAVKLMSADRLGDIPMRFPIKGLGFGLGLGVMKDPATAGYLGSPGTYFWAGAAGTAFWVDPNQDLVAVVMTQYLGMRGSKPGGLQAEAQDLVYEALHQNE